MALAVTYLLEDTPLFGGVKVVLQHANLLHARGHRVEVVSRGASPRWFDLRAPFRQVPELAAPHLPACDVTVATYWTTIRAATAAPGREVLHFCQGFEGIYTHNEAQHGEIEEAYREPLPAMVVAPHLATLLETRFGRPSALVPPPLESHSRGRPRLGPRRRPRVLVMHPWENDWKGVATALEAVRVLRSSGVRCHLVRLSQWPLGDAERAVLTADEFHCHLEPYQAARLIRGCDLLLAPSWEQEAFGLPVLEAFAAGVPVVASEISAFRWYAGTAAVLVPAHRPEAFARAARELLADPRRWRAARRSGFAIARRFTQARVAGALEAALGWVANGRWRSEPPPRSEWG